MKLLCYFLILIIIVYPFYYYMDFKKRKQLKDITEVYLPIKKRQIDLAFSLKNKPPEELLFVNDYIFTDEEKNKMQEINQAIY